MTVNNFYTQKLNVENQEPVYIKNYRLPHSHKEEIDNQINKLIRNEAIEPSQSNYNSPIILVPKKSQDGNKKYRLCIDYRRVNKKLIADKYPLPRIDEILDGLGAAKYFSVIDLLSGFHQIPISPESRDITSFSTPSGSYRWKVLPFGLNISPNSFSRMMSLAFSGLTPSACFLYMDDIIVIGRSIPHHLKNLESIFETCRKYNLKINPTKCQFFRKEVSYIGHRCTDKGILPDNAKLHTMLEYPSPKNKDEVKRFVAFANYYRRFIQNFARIAQPLNKLTRKDTDFLWSKECQTSFKKLKECLVNPPILTYPDFSRPFIVTVDASKNGCGAILSQNFDNNDLPISYASKAFNHAESKKAPIEMELIAVHWAIQHFRPYLYGTKFLVRSDHKPLVHLYSLKDPASRLTRLRLDLEEYDFVIEHIKGKSNVGADALSRIDFADIKIIAEENKTQTQIKVMTRSMTNKNKHKIIKEINNTPNIGDNEQIKIYETINRKEHNKIPTILAQIKDKGNWPFSTKIVYKQGKKPIIQFDQTLTDVRNNIAGYLMRLEKEASKCQISMLKIVDNNPIFNFCSINEFKTVGNQTLKNLNIIIHKSCKNVTDANEKCRILEEFHENPLLGGHSGRNRMYANIRQHYIWKNMSSDIAKYAKKCHKCQLNKVKCKNIEPMVITTTPQRAFDRLIIDTIGPLTKSINDNSYALTVICDLSKYLIMIPLQNKSAKAIATALFNQVILTFGPIKEILSDRGTEFVNETIKELCEMLKIHQITSTAYHHQTLGSIERTHRVFNEYLRAYLDSQTDWEQNMKYFTFCYNITPHSTFNNQYSPFELTFGKTPEIFELINTQNIDPIYNIDNYAKEIKFKLQTAHRQAVQLIEKSKLKNKAIYDQKSKPIDLKVNDKIILVNENRNKHESLYKGPFIITKIIESNIEILDINSKKTQIVHKNNVRKYLA